MRKALIVGIDYYESIAGLRGAVNDARAVHSVLERNEDYSLNFDGPPLVASDNTSAISRASLRSKIVELFKGDGEVALLYFAGHGYIEETGGYICASDTQTGSDGIPLSEIITLANKSKFRNRVILLDSCHSGVAGDHPTNPGTAEVHVGTTILTASTAEQYAQEIDGKGVFTDLFVDALRGGAANLVGDVTLGSVYAHIDQSLGMWAQRPMFKTSIKGFVSLRKTAPALELMDLRRMTEFFPEAGSEYPLDPTYEPERLDPSGHDIPPPNPQNTKIFSILQQYNRVGLLVPVGAPHMWHAAMQSKSVRLTPLGEHYRRLVSSNRI